MEYHTFNKLVQRQRSNIYTVCYMFSNDQDEVNDLFQEVLIKLWQGWKKFRGDSDERTWVYRVALNCCISIDRKKKSKKSKKEKLNSNNSIRTETTPKAKQSSSAIGVLPIKLTKLTTRVRI